jgi:hypothetical protein
MRRRRPGRGAAASTIARGTGSRDGCDGKLMAFIPLHNSMRGGHAPKVLSQY